MKKGNFSLTNNIYNLYIYTINVNFYNKIILLK